MCCFLQLACTEWILKWLGTCFPWKVNTVYAMSWLHLVSTVFLIIACLLSYVARPRDMAFNANLNNKSAAYSNVIDPHKTHRTWKRLNSTDSNSELPYLVKRWNGMFMEQRTRGLFSRAFTIICAVVASINLVLYITTLPVLFNNSCSSTNDSFYKNEWRFYKGKEGFMLMSAVALVTVIITTAAIVETADVVDIEMIYEEYFPYCMRDENMLTRFCFLSHQTLGHNDDNCKELTKAFLDSYLCSDFRTKINACIYASIASICHILMVYGYGQMAYRPWQWTKLKQRQIVAANMKEKCLKRRQALEERAPKKLKLAKEIKKVKLAEQMKREERLEEERRKLEMVIRLKNVRRRLARRASRKGRREKAKQEKNAKRTSTEAKENNDNEELAKANNEAVEAPIKDAMKEDEKKGKKRKSYENDQESDANKSDP